MLLLLCLEYGYPDDDDKDGVGVVSDKEDPIAGGHNSWGLLGT